MKFNKNPYKILILTLGLVSSLTFACTDDGGEDNPTNENLPKIETGKISNITPSTAVCSAEIVDNGSSDINESGICINTTDDSSTADFSAVSDATNGEFSVELTNLQPETTYFVWAFATNSEGTAFGKSVQFKTEALKIEYGANAKDIDGNEYRTVVIGTQTWMVENLKVTKYNDGSSIETTTEDSKWNTLTNGGYCWYNNDEATYKNPYGAIYNWYAVNSGKLCPKGWHVPSDKEWEKLAAHLGGIYTAGEKLKESGTQHWKTGTYGTNETGFTAVGAGTRNFFGSYDGLGRFGCYWSSNEVDDKRANYWNLDDSHAGLTITIFDKATGYSVRCIKD